MSLSIVDPANTGGTEFGLSRYTRYLGCPMQARWLEENPQMSKPAQVGIYGHRMLESWFKGETLDEILVNEHAVEDEAMHAALGVFKQWRKKYQPDVFGTPIAIEKNVRLLDPNVVGIAPFTCRVDMVTRLTQKAIKSIPKQFEIFDPMNDLEPGYWLVDHKFFSQKRMNLEPSLIDDLQFSAYPLAWNATQKQQVRGTIVNVVIMNKKIRNLLVVIPLPDYNKVKRLHNAMAIIHQNMHAPELQANPLFCETYFGTCPVKKAGDCCGY